MDLEAIMINIGYGNMLNASRVIAIVDPDTAPIKRVVQDARENQKLVDATYGSRTRSVIIMDDSRVVLSAIQPETISQRV
jgi:extracellular matrix regulatory protein A